MDPWYLILIDNTKEYIFVYTLFPITQYSILICYYNVATSNTTDYSKTKDLLISGLFPSVSLPYCFRARYHGGCVRNLPVPITKLSPPSSIQALRPSFPQSAILDLDPSNYICPLSAGLCQALTTQGMGDSRARPEGLEGNLLPVCFPDGSEWRHKLWLRGEGRGRQVPSTQAPPHHGPAGAVACGSGVPLRGLTLTLQPSPRSPSSLLPRHSL